VFALNLPDRWETLDDSTDQRILVRLLPPPGYGSRVTVDVINEGPLSPDNVRALAESYLRLHYEEVEEYQPISREDLDDGGVQVVYLYADRQGATGRETLTIHQSGPFFAALRVFLSDRDTASLGIALNDLVGSFQVDPLAPWGTRVAAINPAELRIANTLLWTDRKRIVHYTGEVQNASPADVTGTQVTLNICDEAGIIIAERIQPIDLMIIPQGATAAFDFVLDDLPDGAQVCSEQASAQPASPNPSYTTAVTLNAGVSYHQFRRDLTVDGNLSNLGLIPAHRVAAILIAYDSQNRVIAYAFVPLPAEQRIEPGQHVPFTTVIPELASQPDHVTTLVQAELINFQNPSLAPTAGP
jgi:hypothetical protein